MDLERAQHQPNAWTCGPAALRHGMLWHLTYVRCPAPAVDIRQLAELSLTTCCEKGKERDGRCEHGLQNAAKELDFRLDHVWHSTPTAAYRAIREYLHESPVLVCVDHSNHWLTIVRATARHAFIVDSSRGGDLHQRLTWRLMLTRLAYGLPGSMEFHLYPLVQL